MNSWNLRCRIEDLREELKELEEQNLVTADMVRAWVGSDNMSTDKLIEFATECINELPYFKSAVQEYWDDQQPKETSK